MPAISTPAIILGTLRYSESSKIVRLATRDYGVRSAIAKGALRPRSKFGAALQLLSEGVAHLLLSDHRDLHTLTAFDLTALRAGLPEDMDRFATASALAEVMVRFGSTDPRPEAFDTLKHSLDLLSVAPPVAVGPLGLRGLWELVGALGFTPVLDACARDGLPLAKEGPVAFSTVEGGVLCPECARQHVSFQLPAQARRDLAALVDPVAELPALDAPNLTAHRRLLLRFIRHHLADEADLPALAFWYERGWEGGQTDRRTDGQVVKGSGGQTVGRSGGQENDIGGGTPDA